MRVRRSMASTMNAGCVRYLRPSCALRYSAGTWPSCMRSAARASATPGKRKTQCWASRAATAQMRRTPVRLHMRAQHMHVCHAPGRSACRPRAACVCCAARRSACMRCAAHRADARTAPVATEEGGSAGAPELCTPAARAPCVVGEDVAAAGRNEPAARPAAAGCPDALRQALMRAQAALRHSLAPAGGAGDSPASAGRTRGEGSALATPWPAAQAQPDQPSQAQPLAAPCSDAALLADALCDSDASLGGFL
jgi:hypothetical protein